jgi:hypothetical protein
MALEEIHMVQDEDVQDDKPPLMIYSIRRFELDLTGHHTCKLICHLFILTVFCFFSPVEAVLCGRPIGASVDIGCREFCRDPSSYLSKKRYLQLYKSTGTMIKWMFLQDNFVH